MLENARTMFSLNAIVYDFLIKYTPLAQADSPPGLRVEARVTHTDVPHKPISPPVCSSARVLVHLRVCVFSSCSTMDDDPLNAPEFDPVAFLNHQFPSGQPPVSCTGDNIGVCSVLSVARRHGESRGRTDWGHMEHMHHLADASYLLWALNSNCFSVVCGGKSPHRTFA